MFCKLADRPRAQALDLSNLDIRRQFLPEALDRFTQTGGAIENPLNHDPEVKTVLERICHLEAFKREQEDDHIKKRSFFRMCLDAVFRSSMNLYVTPEEVIESLAPEIIPSKVSRYIDLLWSAGLIDIKYYLEGDHESAMGAIFGLHKVVSSTDMGKTLATVKKQPRGLVNPYKTTMTSC